MIHNLKVLLLWAKFRHLSEKLIIAIVKCKSDYT